MSGIGREKEMEESESQKLDSKFSLKQLKADWFIFKLILFNLI